MKSGEKTGSYGSHIQESILLTLIQPCLHSEVDTNTLTGGCTYPETYQPKGTATEALTNACTGQTINIDNTHRTETLERRHMLNSDAYIDATERCGAVSTDTDRGGAAVHQDGRTGMCRAAQILKDTYTRTPAHTGGNV